MEVLRHMNAKERTSRSLGRRGSGRWAGLLLVLRHGTTETQWEFACLKEEIAQRR